MTFCNLHTDSILKNGLSRFILTIFLYNWGNYLNLAVQMMVFVILLVRKTFCCDKKQGKGEIVFG